nr:zonadhesin-like isoform X1 [Pseudochaenichthys georgianus]
MLGGIFKDVLVTVTLLFLTQTWTQCRAEVDFSLVTLPDWRENAEYGTQCSYDGHNNQMCDWTQLRTEDVTVLESGPLVLEGEAYLEFWYLAPVAAYGTALRTLLKSSMGLREIWTSPALPRDSWRQVFVPLNIIEPGTQVVIEAVSTEGQFIFNHLGVRRGSCGQQCDSNTEFWTDESTRCLCSGGQLSCSPTQCPKGQICGPRVEISSGIHASGMCTIHSHTDCSTFDGVLFRFMASCTYTLVKTCSPSETLPLFSVEVVNEKNWNSYLPTVQEVIVDMGNFRVSLLKRQTHRIVVNGVWKKLPLSLNNGSVKVKSNPAAVELETSFGLSVSYDNAGAVQVALPSTYSDQVCGLCGNYNHRRKDDFRKPDGTNAHDATGLAESWRTGQSTSSCDTILVPHQCDPLEEAEYASELYCGGLLSSTGPFAGCLSVLGAESYFRACVVGMCSTHGDTAVLCETFQIYTDICQEAGVTIPTLRNSILCPLQCGENSHYNSCADGCPEMCSGLDAVGSCGSCEERCECDSGFKLSEGKCVAAEDCGCWDNGKHYEKGASFSKGECKQQCQCVGTNEVQCTTMQCSDNDVCKVKDGVKGCFPFKPATCSVYGDPHYITFDGMAYDFQGGCSYTLTTTCGGESSVQFTVIGHNMHLPHTNFTPSKLEAVDLQVDDLYVTLNQSGEVYVNTSRVRLPYSTNGSYGSVWVYLKNNYIILETTFGLRMIIDAQNRLFLHVDERYKYELCGLCGTFSDCQEDDFVTPGGQHGTCPFEFGDSWKVPGNNECISHPDDPRQCDVDEENEAYNECYILLGDAFKPCHETIHPSIYLSNCVYDFCATRGDRHTLCESLKSYAAACHVAGVELPHWQTDTACAEPTPTTILRPPRSTTTSTTDQTLCPINCDFENNLCGWEQLMQDSFDWTRHSGPTPSSLTGPNQDHTTGAGFYMYIEGSSVTHGDSARLWSSMCHYDGPLWLNFWYHMYGSANAMALNIYLLKDNKATKLWSIMNNQGPEWHLGHVYIRVSGPFQILLEGIRGSDAQSDVAIDDISINFGSCLGSVPGLVSGTVFPSSDVEVLPSQPVCNLDCSFDRSLCSWRQMIRDAFDWTWQRGSTPTLMTGPSADHTGDGHYLYIEASSVTHGDTARLISSECSDSDPQCLQFWYHMHGSADTMGLHVYLLQDRQTEVVWWKTNEQGYMWQMAQVDIRTTRAFKIIIEGRRGSNEKSDLAIDDVKLYRGRCSDLSDEKSTSPSKPDGSPVVAATTDFNKDNVTQAPDNRHPVCQLNCNYEQDLCQWTQLYTDVIDWTRHSGSTPTVMTGPSSDHTTGGGHYLYIEANSASHGDTARLISSECSDSGPQCLQFWYHMYGSADTMGLHVYLLQDILADAVWWKRNYHGNMWHLAQVDLATSGAFQVIIEGQIGSNDQSDVAIDDVSLHRGHCRDLAQPTTPAPTTSNQVATEGTELPQENKSIQPSSTTIPTTTIAPTAFDTQSPTKPDTKTRPQLSTNSKPIETTTTGPETTARLHPLTTEHPGVEPSHQPEPEMTENPQTTEGQEHPVTSTNEPHTTDRPQPPTTATPKPSQTTVQPKPPTTATPQPSQTTVKPQPTTTASPKPPQTTVKPPTTAPPQPPQTTVKPQPTTTASPKPPQTTVKPPTTATPQPSETTVKPPTPASPQPPQTTVKPQPSTTATPKPSQTTVKPQQQLQQDHNLQQPTTTNKPHSTTGRPQPPTEALPQSETTATPKPSQTTVQPQPPTTARPQPPQTTVKPQPTTTAGPQPTTTNKPHSTTGSPQPTTTATPPSTTMARPQPPVKPVPTPSCPENSHYTTCVPACSPTCTHLNGPPRCTEDEGCVQGCVCDEGFVQKKRVCVPIEQCGCVERNGTKYDFSDVWYTSHCSQKCECEKDYGVGWIDCDDKDECDGKAVCLQNDEGNYYCQSTGFSECTIREDPEYTSFDKMKHKFKGDHSYVLVRTNNLPNNLPHVYIEGITVKDKDDSHQHDDSSSEEDHSRRVRDDDDDDEEDDHDNDHDNDDDDSKHDRSSEERKENYSLQELKIRVYNHTVVLKKNLRLVVDGRRTKIPTSPTAGLKIRELCSRISLKTDFGLSVEFDGHGRAGIILPRIYKRKVGGLCGNFDGKKKNDMMKPDGTRAKNVQEFGESWSVKDWWTSG